ncbi:hypothetical protein ACOMHN_024544 [Nucella lapillus]
MATDALCLENIDEFVHDENKIVTCKWLSLTLKIHINQAKRLLYTFLQQQRKKDKDVNATYFVAGAFKGENGDMEHRCLVVSEEDLDTTRKQLSTVTSCHVYSIQRSHLKESNSLYMTDYEGVRENLADCNKYSSIHCQRAEVPRSQPARTTASPDKPRSAQTVDDKGSKGDGQTNGSGSHKTDSVERKGGKGKKAEPKGSIATMFAQSSKKKDADGSRKKETATKNVAKENKPAAKKGGVMDLFANAKPPAKPKAAAAEEKERPATKEVKAAEKKGKKPVSEPKGKKSRRKVDSDSDDQPDKKRRRRIKNDLFDSSSEEEMEIEEESPVPSPAKEPQSDPESPIPRKKTPEKRARETTPPREDTSTKGGKLRRHRRKLVPKTYLDEDGFMVTEKVWESESTDASEVESETQKKAAAAPQKKPGPAPAKKASPQKKTSPVKGKQTSLMSFFKKK